MKYNTDLPEKIETEYKVNGEIRYYQEEGLALSQKINQLIACVKEDRETLSYHDTSLNDTKQRLQEGWQTLREIGVGLKKRIDELDRENGIQGARITDSERSIDELEAKHRNLACVVDSNADLLGHLKKDIEVIETEKYMAEFERARKEYSAPEQEDKPISIPISEFDPGRLEKYQREMELSESSQTSSSDDEIELSIADIGKSEGFIDDYYLYTRSYASETEAEAVRDRIMKALKQYNCEHKNLNAYEQDGKAWCEDCGIEVPVIKMKSQPQEQDDKAGLFHKEIRDEKGNLIAQTKSLAPQDDAEWEKEFENIYGNTQDSTNFINHFVRNNLKYDISKWINKGKNDAFTKEELEELRECVRTSYNYEDDRSFSIDLLAKLDKLIGGTE